REASGRTFTRREIGMVRASTPHVLRSGREQPTTDRLALAMGEVVHRAGRFFPPRILAFPLALAMGEVAQRAERLFFARLPSRLSPGPSFCYSGDVGPGGPAPSSAGGCSVDYPRGKRGPDVGRGPAGAGLVERPQGGRRPTLAAAPGLGGPA